MNIKLNKWFITFMALAIMMVMASTVVFSCGKKNNSTSESESVVDYDGSEIGTFYCDAGNGTEYTVTFEEGNTFTIKIDGEKSGSYKYGADGIVFTFSTATETASATLNGDVLSLTYNGADRKFYRDVEYTVTFSGADVQAKKVRNRKALEEFANPTQDGKVFVGWYTGSDYSTKYEFGVTEITSDTTLYAKWIDIDDSIANYTVSFDLGYEAEKPSVTTINGKLYGIETPERAGYTFAGWYLSDYEDASKLTAEYTEEYVFTQNTTLYATWTAEGSEAELELSVTADRMTWSTLQGINSYN